MGLYHKYRPQSLDEVRGQPSAVATLRGLKKIPHAFLFHGPSGTGKTTLARIMSGMTGCGERVAEGKRNPDFLEMNTANFRGIDMIRQLNTEAQTSPIAGRARVWLIDEAHGLTKDAQNAFLKLLEDAPRTAYFMLATTDPNKLLPTIRSRCTEIGCKGLSPFDLAALVNEVAKGEEAKVSKDCVEQICEVAEGSPRKALVLLEQILGLESEADRIDAIGTANSKRAAFDLVREMMPFKGRPVWGNVAKVLKAIEEESPEGIRRMVIASARSSLLKADLPNMYRVLVAFEKPFFDETKTAHGALAAACYEVVSQWK